MGEVLASDSPVQPDDFETIDRIAEFVGYAKAIQEELIIEGAVRRLAPARPLLPRPPIRPRQGDEVRGRPSKQKAGRTKAPRQ